MQNCTSGVVESSRVERERESSRADNYNAYHKLAVAVAEVWGSAISRPRYIHMICLTFEYKPRPFRTMYWPFLSYS